MAPFADLRDLGALLQRAGFALPVADTEDMPLAYASPMGLVNRRPRQETASDG